MKKTLYVTDLDGTLLRTDKTLSPFTKKTINRLTAEGMAFSCATARSVSVAKGLLAGITAAFPAVFSNGAVIADSQTEEVLEAFYFSPDDAAMLLRAFREAGLSPLIYGHLEGRERFSYLKKDLSSYCRTFLAERAGDRRARPVEREEELLAGKQFFFNCVDGEARLRPLYERLQEQYSCVLEREIYCGGHMLEILPPGVSKANGVRRLAELLGCGRIVAFGDNQNDIPMFEAADACYAVENAVPELKAAATGIIPGNDADGVARWLHEQVCTEG